MGAGRRAEIRRGQPRSGGVRGGGARGDGGRRGAAGWCGVRADVGVRPGARPGVGGRYVDARAARWPRPGTGGADRSGAAPGRAGVGGPVPAGPGRIGGGRTAAPASPTVAVGDLDAPRVPVNTSGVSRHRRTFSAYPGTAPRGPPRAKAHSPTGDSAATARSSRTPGGARDLPALGRSAMGTAPCTEDRGGPPRARA